MSEFYTDVEFAKVFSLRGYGKKKDALKWLKDHKMDHAFEEDFLKCYRDVNPEYIGSRSCRLWADGQNPSDPQNMENSKGKSFEYSIRREQKKIDVIDRWVKRIKEEN